MSAIQTAVPYVAVSGGTFTGAVSFGQHIAGTTTVIGAAAGAGAGTSPPAAVVTQGSSDLGGIITWGTGTAPNTQPQVNLTFSVPWTIPGGGGPHVVVTPQNAATQALGIFVTGMSPTGFSLSVATAPAASQGNTTYSFSYVVMG